MMFIWIPYFQAAGWSDWRSLGFDVATMQPNWAFHSHPGLNNSAELFAKVANDTSCAGMGVEMELPLSVRNPQIPKLSWRSSFDTCECHSSLVNTFEATLFSVLMAWLHVLILAS